MLKINASIAKHKEKIWCAYRTQHLRNRFDAKCVLTELDNEFEPVFDKWLIAENKNTTFEDIRLFSFKDKLLAFYNYLPYKEGAVYRHQYATGFGEIDVETGTIKNHTSFKELSTRWEEKNWSPYAYNDELFMITDFDPFLRVIKINYDNDLITADEIYLSQDQTTGWVYGELRGGTPLLAEPDSMDGWHYGFIHSFLPDEYGFERYYYYTIVRYNHLQRFFEFYPIPLPYDHEEPDDDYELLWRHSNSRRFKVVFPIGIMHYDEGVVVSYGKDDVTSFTEYFSWMQIKDFFDNAHNSTDSGA